MNWQEYQAAVSAFFKSIGGTATVDAPLKGVRGHHKIDVLVRLKVFGIEALWIVECKLWKTSVPKEKVLTLQQIVQDVGADRGFLMSESGFQSGTIKSANSSNITLSSLSELQDMAVEELIKLRFKSVSVSLNDLTHRHYAFMPQDKFSKIQSMDIVLESLADMLLIRTELFKVHGKRFPVFLAAETVHNVKEFVEAAERILTKAEGVIHQIEEQYNHNLITGRKVLADTKDLTDQLVARAKEIAQAHIAPEKKDELRLGGVTIMKKIGDAMIELRGYTTNTSFRYLHNVHRVLIDELYLDLLNENLTDADVAKTGNNLKKAFTEFESFFQPIIIPPAPNTSGSAKNDEI
ncbi:restriction endonuclease [Mucilaginibacter daejeonensis]|uniref:restriction endonuclease n=1 Tax=Mucilaginibacter daejeonensis TaxID=398049 RepID=UPI001D170A2B|nr:restriction endonuclease [Mucilaginibacter daejeonensis]UEG51392.1 restriction endonuclease [Mucilaginibacter daejeonensis]